MIPNKDTVKGKWKHLKGEIQRNWGKITDDELEKTKGDVKSIAGLIQEKYGKNKESTANKLSTIFERFENKKDDAVSRIKEALKK